jgi:hypothetical protein
MMPTSSAKSSNHSEQVFWHGVPRADRRAAASGWLWSEFWETGWIGYHVNRLILPIVSESGAPAMMPMTLAAMFRSR